MARKKTEEQLVKKMVVDFIFGTDLSIRNGWSNDFKIIGHFTYLGLFDLKGNLLPKII